jgi:hypothetical protein
MSTPEINQLTRRLLLLAVGLHERTTLAEVTGERLDAVSSVVSDSRPLRRTRKLVADAVAQRVYDVFGVTPEDRPTSLSK